MKRATLPLWVDYGLAPLLTLAAALAASALAILAVGENPWEAISTLARGALGDTTGLGYTLYYATNFVFAGLAVALPFHGGSFNIGGEGQAYIGGLGAALVCLALPGASWAVVLPLAFLAAFGFGAGWAFVPAWLKATRDSHVVITTIMFNFIASALMGYLLVNVLIAPGQSAPETVTFSESAWLPQIAPLLAGLGIEMGPSPLNLAFPLALLASVVVWLLLWRTRWGYEIRAAGLNESAAAYGGISLGGVTILSLCLGGGLAGLIAVNEVLGAQHRLLLGFSGGYGFAGIAVALMGRNHPLGICLAALLFGALYQGGTELAFDMPAITRDIVVVIEGLVILFCGALESLFRKRLEAVFA